FPRKSRELTVTPWREEPMVLACSPEHRLARGKSVRPSELAGEKFVAFDRGLVIRREVDRFPRDQGASVELGAQFGNIETIKQAVSVGVGVSLLPEQTLRREVGAGTLAACPLAGIRLVRPMAIIQRRGHRIGPAAARFLEFLRTGGLSATLPEAAETAPERNGQAPESPRPSRRKLAWTST